LSWSLSPLLLVSILDISQMSGQTFVGYFDQATVKPLLAATRLVAGRQKDGLALGIESEGYTSDATGRGKPQPLHIRVTRSVESVRAWPP
jgi:hypothetical protein